MLTRQGGYLHCRPSDTGPEASRHLQLEGWALLRDVFDEASVAALRSEVEQVFDDYPPDARRRERHVGELEQFRYEMFNRSQLCRQAIGERKILNVIEPLIGEDCHVIANTAWRNPAGIEHTHAGGRWHIDAGPHLPRHPSIAWDDRIPYPVFVVAAHILLQDCPLACGPTGVIPRSHTSGQPPPEDHRDDPSLSWQGIEPLTLEAAAGDVQLFVSDVWHRRMPTAGGDAGRLFLQVHYGRRDIAQRVRPAADVNHLSEAIIQGLDNGRTRSLLGLHEPFFYDG